MEEIEKQFKVHPYLFGGVAAAIALYFLWPRSTASTGNNTAQAAYQAQVEAGIASAAQSATQLAIAQDQVQIAGINVAGAQAINAQNTAAAQTINGQNTLTAQYIAGQQAAVTTNHNASVLQSQTQAETFVSSLEKAGLAVPNSISVMGANYLIANPIISNPALPNTPTATQNPYTYIDSGSAGASGTAGGAGGNGGNSSGSSAGGPGSY